MSITKPKPTTKPPIVLPLAYCCIPFLCTPSTPMPSMLPAATPLAVFLIEQLIIQLMPLPINRVPLTLPSTSFPTPHKVLAKRQKPPPSPHCLLAFASNQAPLLNATLSTAASPPLAKTPPTPRPPAPALLLSLHAPCPHKTLVGSATPSPPLPRHYSLNQNPPLGNLA